MKSVLISIVFLVSVALLSAQGVDHTVFTDLLGTHVKTGRVDYASLKRDPRFAGYLADLSAVDPAKLEKADKKAFWINVYNAFTLQMVCNNFPIRSIKELAAGKVWDVRFIDVNGKKYTLNEIENNILRPLKDHRIHYALVCAARSCPPLRNEAYEGARLNDQLNEQGKLFLATSSLNNFDQSKRIAHLSHVFEWYLEDFGGTLQSLLSTLAPHAPDAVAKDLQQYSSKWTVAWNEYDWALNGK